MSNNLLQKSYKSLKCHIEGHQDQPCSYVCITYQCKENSLICYLCSEQHHKDHEKLLLKSFIQQFSSIQQKSQKIIPLCAKIDQIFNDIKTKLQKHSNHFTNLDIIYKTLEQYRTINIDYALGLYKLNEKISDLFQERQINKLKEKLNRFVKNQYFKYFSQIEQQQWVKLNIGQRVLEKKIQSLTSTLNSLEKLKSINKLDDNYVLNLFPLLQESSKKIKVYFSEEMKPACMKIISQTQAKMEASGTQRLLILQPCLSKNNSVKKWAVKIIKLASWIGVGVCHANQVKKANYMFNYSNLGHGNYLISSNGYSWSSYKKEFNSKFEPFSYTTGDLIQVQYDPKQHMVRFKKQSDINQPTYQIQIEPNDDPIYPEINLTGVGDEVEIINY